MNNLEVALCDLNDDYIVKFASYLMEHAPGVGIHIFTTTESYFADTGNYDLAIMTSDFKDVEAFKQSGGVKHKYFLYEEGPCELDDYIFKYQSMELILDSITEIKSLGGQKKASIKKSNEKSQIIGVYSPISHELQLPFAMALGQSFKDKGKVLFLDLEELSILPELIGGYDERNLMDLLYEINTTTEKIDLSEYARSFMGFDYIEPFLNPNEINEIDADTWNRFFDKIEKADYDVVVVLFGRAINGFSDYLSRLQKLYVLGKPGDYFKKGQESFLRYLDRINIETNVENVMLPMSAGNLSEGAYCIEELLQGNLGMFVRKLINSTESQQVAIYG